MALENAGILEQLHRAIDGGDGDMRIDRGRAAIELFRVGMILSIRQHARDDAALLGHAQTLVHAKLFYPRHGVPSLMRAGL